MDKPQLKLSGTDGNAFLIIGKTLRAINDFNRGKYGSEIIDVDRVQMEMISGDYDHVIQTAMRYCEVS